MAYLWLWEQEPSTVVQAGAAAGLKKLQGYSKTYPIGQPSLQICTAWQAFLNGRQEEAIAGMATAVQIAEQLEMPYEAALARYHGGRFAGSGKGKMGLETAVAVFTQLGLAWETEQAQKALTPIP